MSMSLLSLILLHFYSSILLYPWREKGRGKGGVTVMTLFRARNHLRKTKQFFEVLSRHRGIFRSSLAALRSRRLIYRLVENLKQNAS